jgi:gamma-glutamyltranspeptidase/glutathione hydrolase
MLNVVEPFSTGIGGDCFVLFWDASRKTIFALNGSGPSAQAADLDELIGAGYKKHPHFTGHAVSVPGTVGAWATLLKRFGRMSFGEVLAPAIHYAFEGYPVSELIGSGWPLMVNRLLRKNNDESVPKHLQFPGPPQPSGNEFLIEGRAPTAGEIMTLPTLGETLTSLAAEGKDYIYKGEFAKQLCDHVQLYGGWLETTDLAEYHPEWVEPIYADYRGVRLYECPPNGQGLAAIIAVKLAHQFDLAGMNPVELTHTLIECMRLGFLDSLQPVADPQYSEILYDRLFSDETLQMYRVMIDLQTAIEHLPT